MRCPHCKKFLGDGMLPSRCPSCGRPLRRGRMQQSSRNLADIASSHASRVRGLVDVSDKRELGRRRKRLAFGLVLVLLMAAALVYVTYAIQLWGGRTVPDVVGWRSQTAVDAVERAGFRTSVEYRKADGEPGFVLDMTPAGGMRANTDSPVVIVVSDACVMPQVVGKPRQEAEDAVRAEGLKVNVDLYPSDEEEGTVVAASAEPGVVLGEGTDVRLGVARPRVVPAVTGKTEADARAAIEAEGGSVEVTYVAPGPGQADGSVVATEPAAGETIEGGEEVRVTVARSLKAAMDQTARAAVTAIYGCGDPAAEGTGVGAQLRGLLSPDAKVGGKPAQDASDHDLWYDLVKHNRKLPSRVDAAMDELVRHVDSVDAVEVDEAGHKVKATFHVTWEWAKMGTSYQGTNSSDTRTVTFATDDAGRLVSVDDPQTDIPFYDFAS